MLSQKQVFSETMAIDLWIRIANHLRSMGWEETRIHTHIEQLKLQQEKEREETRKQRANGQYDPYAQGGMEFSPETGSWVESPIPSFTPTDPSSIPINQSPTQSSTQSSPLPTAEQRREMRKRKKLADNQNNGET